MIYYIFPSWSSLTWEEAAVIEMAKYHHSVRRNEEGMPTRIRRSGYGGCRESHTRVWGLGCQLNCTDVPHGLSLSDQYAWPPILYHRPTLILSHGRSRSCCCDASCTGGGSGGSPVRCCAPVLCLSCAPHDSLGPSKQASKGERALREGLRRRTHTNTHDFLPEPV